MGNGELPLRPKPVLFRGAGVEAERDLICPRTNGVLVHDQIIPAADELFL